MAENKEKATDQIDMAINIFRLSDIDEIKQTFQVDMSYAVLWNDADASDVETITTTYPTQSPHHVDIRNSFDSEDAYTPYLTQYPRDQIPQYSGETSKHNFRWMARAKLSLSCPILLRDFPYDTQDLEIVVRLPRTADRKTNLCCPRVRFVGVLQAEWTIYSPQIVEKYENQPNMIVVKIPAQRSPFYFVVNIAGIMTLLTSICAYVAVLPVDAPGDRAQITTTLLLTSVAFKFLVASQLPKVSYLTQLDFYFMFAFFCQGAVILENALVSLMTDTAQAEMIDRYFFIIGCIIWVVWHVFQGGLLHFRYQRFRRRFGTPVVEPADGYYRRNQAPQLQRKKMHDQSGEVIEKPYK
eukprot:gb/GEZN01006363.1/.p1 GENE.gb/GEZN01006363.1/~~gb/GEZN01006363.1/.p1  ORF type:complete len:354 (+),score=27.55 gb/GEZN01006363.1/:137-1198(+)